MRLLVLHSRSANSHDADRTYLQTFDARYAQRVIDNLMHKPGFCSACGAQCVACRNKYDARPDSCSIPSILHFPTPLPHVLEQPDEFLPRHIPSHDILLAVHIHEQLLLELLKKCDSLDTKGVIIPLEAAEWLSGSGKAAACRICEAAGIEIAFPKPFCAFMPPSGSVLAEFRRLFRIGYPEVRIEVRDNTIINAHVDVSAACGATYFVAQSLVGKHLDSSLHTEIVSKALHSYPCTASMQIDPEIGDTPLHVAGQAHYRILAPWEHLYPDSAITAPSQQENVLNIRKAQQAILQAVEKGPVEMVRLMKDPGLLPAAVSSALIMLKQQGKIQTQHGQVYAVNPLDAS